MTQLAEGPTAGWAGGSGLSSSGVAWGVGWRGQMDPPVLELGQAGAEGALGRVRCSCLFP